MERFERWQISQDGEPGGPIYHDRTHRARHDRQTVLLQHGAPPVARLRDLNTRSRDAHLVYGHAWDELTNDLVDRANADPKATLIDKATRGVLVGEGVRVILATIDKPDTRGFTRGDPAFLTPERQGRLRNHPRAFELNRVPGGICLLAQGPSGRRSRKRVGLACCCCHPVSTRAAIGSSWNPRSSKTAARSAPSGCRSRPFNGFGPEAAQHITAVRAAFGEFTSLLDFCRKVDRRLVSRHDLQLLVKLGAFGFTGLSRAQLSAAELQYTSLLVVPSDSAITGVDRPHQR